MTHLALTQQEHNTCQQKKKLLWYSSNDIYNSLPGKRYLLVFPFTSVAVKGSWKYVIIRDQCLCSWDHRTCQLKCHENCPEELGTG